MVRRMSCGKWAGLFRKICDACSAKAFVASVGVGPQAAPASAIAPEQTGTAIAPRITAGFALDESFPQGPTTREEYAALRYEQMTDPDVMDALPFWQYLTVGDDRVRPSHAILDRFTALATDPVWKRIYPPRGRACRCIVIPLLASDDAREDGVTRLRILREEFRPNGPRGKEREPDESGVPDESTLSPGWSSRPPWTSD
jgi:hypothetical protein